jgi:hypothetical protein
MIEISEAGPDRTRLIVRHADLPDDPDSRGAHDRGWAGALTKLERLLSA